MNFAGLAGLPPKSYLGEMADVLFTFQAGLCEMASTGQLAPPYEGCTIDGSPSVDDAVRRAKRWASSERDAGNVREDSHLQVLLDGNAVASLKPGEF